MLLLWYGAAVWMALCATSLLCLRSCLSCCLSNLVGVVDSSLDDLLFLRIEIPREVFVDTKLFLLETCA